MAIVQPVGTDTLSADNHTLMHNVFAIDSAATAKSVVVDSNSRVQLNPITIVTGAVVTNTGASLILTAANMVKNSIFQQTGTTAPTFTTDTGSNISTLFPNVAVGNCFFFVISNASNQTITVNGTTGCTLANVMTVLTLQSRTFWCINTGTNTWTVF